MLLQIDAPLPPEHAGRIRSLSPGITLRDTLPFGEPLQRDALRKAEVLYTTSGMFDPTGAPRLRWVQLNVAATTRSQAIPSPGAHPGRERVAPSWARAHDRSRRLRVRPLEAPLSPDDSRARFHADVLDSIKAIPTSAIRAQPERTIATQSSSRKISRTRRAPASPSAARPHR